MLGRKRRLVLLAEAHFNAVDAKTAVGLLRYRPDEVVAVIDSARAGRTAAECVGVGGGVPVVADVAAAAALGADSLLIGIAPQGGGLPPAWRTPLREALERGWDVFSGLHTFPPTIPSWRYSPRVSAHSCDVRRFPPGRGGAGRLGPRGAPVGAIANQEDDRGAQAPRELQRTRAAFAPPVALRRRRRGRDRCRADFAGAIEALVLEAARGRTWSSSRALHHPGYSGVTLPHCCGAAPLRSCCHQCVRTQLRAGGGATRCSRSRHGASALRRRGPRPRGHGRRASLPGAPHRVTGAARAAFPGDSGLACRDGPGDAAARRRSPRRCHDDGEDRSHEPLDVATAFEFRIAVSSRRTHENTLSSASSTKA
jgi:hypothetical protein